jgi:hypothetical protein
MHEAPIKGAEGLKIFPPKGSFRYNSVETAISRNARVLKDVCPGSFYAHIGVVAMDASRSLISVSSVSRSDVSDEDVLPRSRCGSHVLLTPMTLEELLQKKCGECFNCEKDDCGHCASCVLNPRTQVCIQKVSSQYLAIGE